MPLAVSQRHPRQKYPLSCAPLCFQADRDPNRHHWLIEELMTPAFERDESMFLISMRLFLLQVRPVREDGDPGQGPLSAVLLQVRGQCQGGVRLGQLM